LVADANYLYREMILANQNLRTMKQRVGEDGVGQERLALYKSFKAVTGLGDPLSQKSRDKNVKGLLQTIFGSRAKMSTVQRKLLGTTVDHVGRAVIAPDPDLDIDHVGLPESAAFDVYQRFIVRRLKRNGMPVAQALQEVKDHTPLARKIMLEEFAHRPVIVNRAPVLHKFGIMAHWPVLVPGHVMKVPPLTMAGMGSDADGDTQNFHVPVSEEARIEAIERLLPSHQLTSPADLKRAMYVPSHEFLAGLFNSTTAKSKHKYTFATLKDAEAAWAAGKLTAADQVTILRK
jgi:DNA-directed RNA polymerase subunit beta'